MLKYAMDYSGLQKLSKRAYKLSDVKSQLEVVGFDIVRFKDADKGADLWQVQSADDGDYIVALYDEPEEQLTVEANAKSLWQVKASSLRLWASKLGIPATELKQAENYLPSKLASNPKLVKALLRELPDLARLETLKRYPELS